MKKKNTRPYLYIGIGTAVFVLAALFTALSGTIWLKDGDEMGYTLFYFYFLLPFVSLFCSYLIGRQKPLMKWIYPAAFGATGLLLAYVVYGHIDGFALWFAGIPSLIGIIIGSIVRCIKIK